MLGALNKGSEGSNYELSVSHPLFDSEIYKEMNLYVFESTSISNIILSCKKLISSFFSEREFLK